MLNYLYYFVFNGTSGQIWNFIKPVTARPYELGGFIVLLADTEQYYLIAKCIKKTQL